MKWFVAFYAVPGTAPAKGRSTRLRSTFKNTGCAIRLPLTLRWEPTFERRRARFKLAFNAPSLHSFPMTTPGEGWSTITSSTGLSTGCSISFTLTLQRIDLDGWDRAKVCFVGDFFYRCSSIEASPSTTPGKEWSTSATSTSSRQSTRCSIRFPLTLQRIDLD